MDDVYKEVFSMKKLICKLMSIGLLLQVIFPQLFIATNAEDDRISSNRKAADDISGIYYLNIRRARRMLILSPVNRKDGLYKYELFAIDGRDRRRYRKSKLTYSGTTTDDSGSCVHIFDSRKGYSYAVELQLNKLARVTFNDSDNDYE